MKNLLLPDFAIIGAQKSASTFVHDGLSRHPDVYIPKNEVRFFEDPEYGSGNLNEISMLFEGHGGRIRGIKRPDYLGRPEVPDRIREANPDIRLIAVLRNPVDRFVSAYYYYIKLGFLPAVDINDAVPDILRGKLQGSPKSFDLLAYGNYATHLRRYLDAFPRNQLLMLLQEDIAKTPETSLERACLFIGAKPGAVQVGTRESNAGVYPLRRLQFLTKRNKYLYDYDSLTGKLIEKKLTPGAYLAAAAITAIDRLVLAPIIGNDKPLLKADTRKMLYDYYRDEVVETQKLSGLDLTGWLAP